MAVKIKNSRALGTLSLTPLIDVVFLLLVFFLVATRFAQEDRELDVLLPSASTAAAASGAPGGFGLCASLRVDAAAVQDLATQGAFHAVG